MKTLLKTGFAALVLLLSISCTKENNNVNPLAVNGKGSGEEQMTGIDGAAATPSIKIGTQRWMTKNLDVTRYRNGDIIPQVKDSAAWAALTTGAWCYYKNDRANGTIYGKLYNWYAVKDIRGLAPAGYHIPTDAEWATLSTFLGEDTAGGKMKSTGTIETSTGLWYYPNTNATNSSGFTGLPGGYRNNNAVFYYIGNNGYFWSSTENSNNVDAYYRNLSYDNRYLFRTFLNKGYGYSVRCVKD